ncbi:FAD/NAD(P)-binding protein [Enterococcus gallinarum]|nr:FAD/NAD(P)-binding protein [Enterococcus gallinarum]
MDPDGHCSRALYGLYQKWFYQQLVETLPHSSHSRICRKTPLA